MYLENCTCFSFCFGEGVEVLHNLTGRDYGRELMQLSIQYTYITLPSIVVAAYDTQTQINQNAYLFHEIIFTLGDK